MTPLQIARRPFTASVTEAVRDQILVASPATALEHLVQAWDALGRAARGENEVNNVSYARRRLACARSAAVARSVPAGEQAHYEAECALLETAILDVHL